MRFLDGALKLEGHGYAFSMYAEFLGLDFLVSGDLNSFQSATRTGRRSAQPIL